MTPGRLEGVQCNVALVIVEDNKAVKSAWSVECRYHMMHANDRLWNDAAVL